MPLDWLPNTNPMKVTPQAIKGLVGERKKNISNIGIGEYQISPGQDILLQHEATGKEVEVGVFSDNKHPKHPESVKVKLSWLWIFPRWVPMSEFVIHEDEIPEGSTSSPMGSGREKSTPDADDGPIMKAAEQARSVS